MEGLFNSIPGFGVDTSNYKTPDYILEATKRKYGEDIFVIGVSSSALNTFLKGMSYHTLGTTRPVELGRAVVDVDCKSHTNTAQSENGKPIAIIMIMLRLIFKCPYNLCKSNYE